MPSQGVLVQGSAASALQSGISTQASKSPSRNSCACPSPYYRNEHRELSSGFACSSYLPESMRQRISQRLDAKQIPCRKARTHVKCAAAPVGLGPEDDGEDEGSDFGQGSADFRSRLNAMMEDDSQSFRGSDLADLIRDKYGRSYDAVFIQKDFMGRKLLALNIMWKYQEQRSFPLTEDEYIYRLDGIAETLREWGAVSMVKNSLKSTRERPRIGKAVSLMIDPELLGARGNEWLMN